MMGELLIPQRTVAGVGMGFTLCFWDYPVYEVT